MATLTGRGDIKTSGKSITLDSTGTGPTTVQKGTNTAAVNLTLPDESSELVGDTATQTLTNKTIDGDDNTVQDLPLTSLKTVLADADKVIARDENGIPVSVKITDDLVDVAADIARDKLAPGSAGYVLINDGTGEMSEEEFLDTERGGLGVDASNFTGVLKASSGSMSASEVSNIDIASNAGIDVSKFADGSVDNAEFEALAGVTSNIQDQLDSKQPVGDYQPEDENLTEISELTGNGILVKRDSGFGWTFRQVVPENDKITVANRDGSGGNIAVGVDESELNIENMAGTLPLTRGGTGQTSAPAALTALLPSQATHAGKALVTDGTSAAWEKVAGGLVPVDVPAATTTLTAVTNTMYKVGPNTSLEITLPGGTTEASVGIVDRSGASISESFPVYINGNGQPMGQVSASDRIKMNYKKAQILLYRAAGTSYWTYQVGTTTSAPPASASVEGVVKKNRYQTKQLTANHSTSNGLVFSFSGLVVGKMYRLTVTGTFVRGEAGGYAMLHAYVNGAGQPSAIVGLGYGNTSSPIERISASTSLVFMTTTATANVYGVYVGVGSMTLGDPITGLTYATLEELNNYEATTAW